MNPRHWLSTCLALIAVSTCSYVLFVASPVLGEQSNISFRPGAIEDPSGHALDHFFASLHQTELGTARSITRIAHYGDSLIVSDQITSTLRQHFQQRFGDAGHGFVLAGRPWDWYRHDGIRHGASSGWHDYASLNGGPQDGFFGYGGVTFSTRRPRLMVNYRLDETSTGPLRASAFDIHYLVQPDGGDLEVLVDEEHLLTLSTEGEESHSAFHRLIVPERQHRLSLRTAGGPVRLFGVAFERSGPGVVYDSLGINGACTTALGRIDEQHFSEQLHHRKPDLIVLAFGANESNRPAFANNYHETVLPTVRRIRRASSSSSCLMISALDRGERMSDGTVRSHRNVDAILRGQREVAAAAGCAFFDTYTAMGGESSMLSWSRNGLASMDLVHPTPEGAELIGRGIYRAIEEAYDEYRRSR